MSRRPLRTLALSLLLCLFALPAQAEVVIKLATLAPEGTTWFKAMRQIGDKWTELSGGEVKVKIYAGGVVGNEASMIRKMRVGQLHGGQITNIGLADYDKGPQVVQSPMLIQNDAELDFLMSKMGPTFEKRLLERGVIVLNWGDAGWIHLFTQTPMTATSQTRDYKIYAYDGDPEAVKLFTTFGFNPVVMTATDVLPSLQSGLINSFPSTRLGALSLQWFALSKHMLDVPWAPLMGATVISQEAWDQIPAKYHAAFLQAAHTVGDEVRSEIRRQDVKAVEVMKKFGLEVHSVDAATRKQWETLGRSTWDGWRGKVVPPEIFDEALGLIEGYRKQQ